MARAFGFSTEFSGFIRSWSGSSGNQWAVSVPFEYSWFTHETQKITLSGFTAFLSSAGTAVLECEAE